MAEDRILPAFKFTLDPQGLRQDIQEAIGVALGAASVCWEPMDCTGVFMSQRAAQIVDELMALVMLYASLYRVTHNDETMQKVYQAMRKSGLTDQQVIDAVMLVQNAGILFREASWNA
jgi:hypothetical protein